MNVQLWASFVILLCYCCYEVDGTLDRCARASMACIGGRSDPGNVCKGSTDWLTCIDATRNVCHLVETHVTFRQLAAVYSKSCNALISQLQSALNCQSIRSCTAHTEYAKSFNITDVEKLKEKVSHEVIKTSFWCRYWMENLGCYLSNAKACSQSADDIRNVTEHMDNFKATCKMTSGSNLLASTLILYRLAAFVLLWIHH